LLRRRLTACKPSTAQTALILLGVTAVVWIRGDAVRSGLVEAKRQRELRARQAVADERTRIARELHDVGGRARNVGEGGEALGRDQPVAVDQQLGDLVPVLVDVQDWCPPSPWSRRTGARRTVPDRPRPAPSWTPAAALNVMAVRSSPIITNILSRTRNAGDV